MYMLSYLFDLARATWHQKLYLYAIYLSYILFAIAYTGIIAVSPEYLQTLNTFTKYYVALFLILRFNPWNNNAGLAVFDRRIAFSAGTFLLLTSTAVGIAKTYFNKFVGKVGKIISYDDA